MTNPPTASRVSARLRIMAEAGDMGRKPDPSDIRRIAAAMIDEYDRSLRTAVWNLFKKSGQSDDAAIAAVEFEIGRIARVSGSDPEGEKPQALSAKHRRAARSEARGNAQTVQS